MALSSRIRGEVGPASALPSVAAGDDAHSQLARWALAHGCPPLRFRPWATVVGTALGWLTFLRTATDPDIAAVLNAARDQQRDDAGG